jgi:hypothetical protein
VFAVKLMSKRDSGLGGFRFGDGLRQRWREVGGTLGEPWPALVRGLKVVSEITGLARSTINRGEDA